MKSIFSAIILCGLQAAASASTITDSLNCKINLDENGHLSAVPKFNLKIGYDPNSGKLMLIENPLRPIGAPAQYVELVAISSTVFETVDGLVKVTFTSEDKKIATVEGFGLAYTCSNTAVSN